MRFLEFKNGIQTYVTEEEQILLDRIHNEGQVSKQDLDEREQIVANKLTQKNILIRRKQDETLNYKISKNFTATH